MVSSLSNSAPAILITNLIAVPPPVRSPQPPRAHPPPSRSCFALLALPRLSPNYRGRKRSPADARRDRRRIRYRKNWSAPRPAPLAAGPPARLEPSASPHSAGDTAPPLLPPNALRSSI